VITLADLEAARGRIADHVLLSPCPRSEAIGKQVGCTLFLKLENLQRTGSFKERGACNKLAMLVDDYASRGETLAGVVCASAGNHAQGIAFHATARGIDATIVMPETTPLVKVQNTRAFGGRVVLHGANYDEAYEEARRIEAAEGRVFVHAFDDDAIIAGQGTIGLELLEQVANLDAVVLAIGGGGLAAGIAVALKSKNPKIEIYGVQTVALPSMKAARAAGHPVTLPAAKTLAEGIAVRTVGARTFEILSTHLDGFAVVDDEEIAEAILVLLEREKTLAEGAGAAPLAALLQGRLPVAGKRVAVVICGGNLDVNVLSRIIERGLVKSGRRVRLAVQLPDVSGALARLTRIVGEQKANILEIHHNRAYGHADLGEARVELVLETRGYKHADEVEACLVAAGYLVRPDASAPPVE
jgi:threonine dehydratase